MLFAVLLFGKTNCKKTPSHAVGTSSSPQHKQDNQGPSRAVCHMLLVPSAPSSKRRGSSVGRICNCVWKHQRTHQGPSKHLHKEVEHAERMEVTHRRCSWACTLCLSLSAVSLSAVELRTTAGVSAKHRAAVARVCCALWYYHAKLVGCRELGTRCDPQRPIGQATHLLVGLTFEAARRYAGCGGYIGVLFLCAEYPRFDARSRFFRFQLFFAFPPRSHSAAKPRSYFV